MKKQLFAMMVAGLLAPLANAATMSFDNGSGSYSASGVTGTVGTTGGSLFYNGVENAIGVGTNVLNGALAQGETLSVSFSQTITVTNMYFRQWENPGLFFTYDNVNANDGDDFSTNLIESDQVIGLLDRFAINDDMSGFTLTPQNGVTAVYLHSIDFEVAEVPLPAAAWLFGSAVVGLGGIARRKRKQS